MSYSVVNNSVGKGLQFDGSTLITYYGADFNPTNPSTPSGWNTCGTTGTTTNFDLSGFQPGHEVGCYVWSLQFNNSFSGNIIGEFLRSTDGNSWSTMWNYEWYISGSSGGTYMGWMYFGVDDDEIRDGYNYYKIHLYGTSGNVTEVNIYSPTFTISNLSIDSTLHRGGHLWIQGSHLCYTDCTGWETGNNGYGYKHSIAYDGNFSEYVGTQYSGYIWLQTDVVRRIYYIDQYGYKRRTYEARNWYNYTSGQGYRPGNAVYGRLWCAGDYDYAEDGYGHLCFVNQGGYLMRILNGPPSGVA